jgi:hypothetical protein
MTDSISKVRIHRVPPTSLALTCKRRIFRKEARRTARIVCLTVAGELAHASVLRQNRPPFSDADRVSTFPVLASDSSPVPIFSALTFSR